MNNSFATPPSMTAPAFNAFSTPPQPASKLTYLFSLQYWGDVYLQSSINCLFFDR